MQHTVSQCKIIQCINHHLEHAIATFMAHFRATFPGENIPIKMHMLEDHAVDWIRSNQHIGFGLMGEQRAAESIHARFNLYTKLTAPA